MGFGYVYVIGCELCPFVYIGSTKNPVERWKVHQQTAGTWRANNPALRACTHQLELIALYCTRTRESAYELEAKLQTVQSWGFDAFCEALLLPIPGADRLV